MFFFLAYLTLYNSFWTELLEKTLESPLDCKEIQPVHPKGNQSWIFIGRTDFEAETPNTLATWCEELTHLKRPWSWERLKVGGEGDYRDRWTSVIRPEMDDRLDGITDSWVGVSSRNSWWIGRLRVLQSMVSQRVGHNWATKVNWGKLWAQNHCLNKYVHVE